MAQIPEDYLEQFSAMDGAEALPKIQAAAERAKIKGCTFPQVTWFEEHKVTSGPDAGKILYVFQAWKQAPRWPDTAAPAHPMLAPAA